MNIGQLFMALSNTPKDEETVLVCYTRSDVQEMLERDISREEWNIIVSEIEKTCFYDDVFEKVKSVAERVLEPEDSNE